MVLTKTQAHVVKAGETLSYIAQKNGFSDWKKLYYATVNEEFRKQRSNPNLIRPGDKIYIPADYKAVVTTLQERLSKLEDVKREADQLMNKTLLELRMEYRRANRVARAQLMPLL